MFVLILNQRTLSSRTNRTHGRMPTKVGQVETGIEAGLQNIFALADLKCLSVDDDFWHALSSSPQSVRALCSSDMLFEVVVKVFHGTLQRFHRAWCQRAVSVADGTNVLHLIGKGF